MSNPLAPADRPSLSAAYFDLFERMLDATFLVDSQSYKILEMNPSAERIIGEEHASKYVGRSVLEMVDEATRDEFSKALRMAMRRFHPRLFETKWKFSEGDSRVLTMELLACPLVLSNGTDILQIIARDITFRREAEVKMNELMVDLQKANAKLELMATTDEMTGLFNFRYFKEQLTLEHERARRYNTPYAIVFTDVDNFKHYNDRNGHPAGDALLKEVAQIIKGCVRMNDVAARYGGEEFVVLCPAVSWENALVVAERIRSRIEQAPLANGEHQPLGKVTISVGVASFPADGQTAEEIKEAADQALYRSKTNGRNRVTAIHPLRLPIKKAS